MKSNYKSGKILKKSKIKKIDFWRKWQKSDYSRPAYLVSKTDFQCETLILSKNNKKKYNKYT